MANFDIKSFVVTSAMDNIQPISSNPIDDTVELDQFNFEKVESRGARSLRLSFREPPKAGSFTKNADVTLML